MAKYILKKSERDCCVKISGPAGTTETISLGVDLLTDREILTPGEDQRVNIIGLTWTGVLDSMSQISRNGVVVTSMQANTTGQFDFEGQGMSPDSSENDGDLVVTITGGQSECWIRLRKLSGYTSKIETAIFGQYDDPNAVGS